MSLTKDRTQKVPGLRHSPAQPSCYQLEKTYRLVIVLCTSGVLIQDMSCMHAFPNMIQHIVESEDIQVPHVGRGLLTHHTKCLSCTHRKQKTSWQHRAISRYWPGFSFHCWESNFWLRRSHELYFFFNNKQLLFWILWSYEYFFVIMKINNFRGDLSNISAKTATLHTRSELYFAD